MINLCQGKTLLSIKDRIEWERKFEEKLKNLDTKEKLDLNAYRAESHELRSK